MNVFALQFWLDVAQMLGMGCLAVYSWLISRQVARSAAVAQLRDETEATDQRVGEIESLIGRLPERDDLRAVEQSLGRELDQVSRRVDGIERDLRHVPSHDDLGQIHEKINRMGAGLEGMRGQLVAINRTLSLINEHLLSGKQR